MHISTGGRETKKKNSTTHNVSFYVLNCNKLHIGLNNRLYRLAAAYGLYNSVIQRNDLCKSYVLDDSPV
jgi:hypothetical protein